MMPIVNLQGTIRAVGTSAVQIVALVMLYLIGNLTVDPWVKLLFALPPGALVLGGVVWMLSGGEQGTHVEVRDGQRHVAITNVNVFAQALARSALDAFSAPPLPPPSGVVRDGGSPAELADVIEAEVGLPRDVEVAEKPIEPPKDAGQLR